MLFIVLRLPLQTKQKRFYPKILTYLFTNGNEVEKFLQSKNVRKLEKVTVTSQKKLVANYIILGNTGLVKELKPFSR